MSTQFRQASTAWTSLQINKCDVSIGNLVCLNFANGWRRDLKRVNQLWKVSFLSVIAPPAILTLQKKALQRVNNAKFYFWCRMRSIRSIFHQLALLQMNLSKSKFKYSVNSNNLLVSNFVDEILKINLRKPIKFGTNHQKRVLLCLIFLILYSKQPVKNKFMFICTFAYVIALIYRWKNHTNKCC